jgi:hypothetical protein
VNRYPTPLFVTGSIPTRLLNASLCRVPFLPNVELGGPQKRIQEFGICFRGMKIVERNLLVGIGETLNKCWELVEVRLI